MTDEPEFSPDRELVLDRLLDAPPAAVYRCWTDPDLIKRWYTPPPWRTTYVELDVRAGGSNLIVIEGPNGEEASLRGVYLDVAPGERLVFTDAFVKAWEPSEHPFMTVTLTFAEEDGKTRYIARARHWTPADRKRHEEMGFLEGWGVAADQLEVVAKGL